MFFLKKLINKAKIYTQLKILDELSKDEKEKSSSEEDKLSLKISKNLTHNLSSIKDSLGSSADIKIHEFTFGPDNSLSGALLYIDGLVSTLVISEVILKPIHSNNFINPNGSNNNDKTVHSLKEAILYSGDVTESDVYEELTNACLGGDTVIFFNNSAKALIVSTKSWESRSISEPQTEAVVRGPREGFTENFRTNTSMLRRKIKSPSLRLDHMTIGEKTMTNIAIAYLDGVADPEMIKSVKSRLKSISVDAILESGYIEQYIEDAPFSLFPTVGYSEKPDVVAAKILEGRAAIIIDGTPFVLTVPMLFIESFQTSEDYYVRPYIASFTRLLRFIAFFISIFLPSIFISLTTFHQELLPANLLSTIASAREGTPFPAFVEALIMVFAFEILREAGLRLPRPVGQAISIVGALIMGEAAVSAGLVGAPMVITVALSAVAGFLVPNQNDAVVILRITSMCIAAFLGGFGIAMSFLGILIHLGALKSFGVVYFDGLIPSENLKDSYIRMPLWTMVKRPKDIAVGDTTRLEYFMPPKEENSDGKQN